MNKIICEFCGKEFYRQESKIKKYLYHFCSNKCQGKYESLRNVEPYIGKKFGNLKILGYAGSDDDNRSLVECLCDCGKKTIKQLRGITKGVIKNVENVVEKQYRPSFSRNSSR